MKSFKVSLILIAAIAVVALASGCKAKTTTPTTTTQEVQVKNGNVTVSVTATGNLAYSDQENLSFSAGGTITKINENVGDIVKKGDILASLDDATALSLQQAVAQAQVNYDNAVTALQNLQTPYTADQIAAAQAAVDTAQSNVNKAQQQLADAQAKAPLSIATAQDNVVTAKTASDNAYTDYANAKITYQAYDAAYIAWQMAVLAANEAQANAAQSITDAQTALANAKATLGTAQTTLTNETTPPTANQLALAQANINSALNAVNDAKANSTDITSPFDGVVIAVNNAVGDVVQKGVVVLTVADTSKIEADISVNETDMPSVMLGMAATVQPAADTSLTVPARVTYIAPVATNQSGVVNFLVKADLTQITAGTRTNPNAGTTATPEQQQAAQQEVAADLAKAVSAGQITQAQSDQLQSRLNQIAANMTTAQIDQLIQTMIQRGVTNFGQGGGTGNNTGSGNGTGGRFLQNNGSAAATTTAFQLRSGLTVTVNLIVQQAQNVLIVPNQAIKTQNGASYVTVKNSDGTTQQVQVTTGLKDYQNTEITKGLTAGETVIYTRTAATATTTTTQPRSIGFGGLGGAVGGRWSILKGSLKPMPWVNAT